MKNQFICHLISLVILVCAGILPYAHTLAYPFHGDSVTQIANNSNIRNPLEINNLWQAHPSKARFLPSLSFALNFAFSGQDPLSYRVVNIGLHVINGLLLWCLILTIFSTPRLVQDHLNPQRYAIALFAALIFLTHPLQTQAVSYVIQRSMLLVTMFGLLTMISYLKGRLAENGVGWMMGACFFGLCAMMSKEVAFTFPLMIILLEFYLLKSGKFSLGAAKSFHFRHLLFITLYLLIIPGLYQFDYESILNADLITRSYDAEAQRLTPGRYFISQYQVLLVYLQKLFLPLRLSFDYDMPVAMAFEGNVVWGLIAFTALCFIALFLHGRAILVTIGLLGFFILLSVESTIVPLVELIQEHRLYMALGLLGMGMVAWIYAGQKRAIVGHLICIVLISGLAYKSYHRNFVYQDRLTLWQDVTEQFPGKARAFTELATLHSERGDYLAALRNVREALQINREFPAVYLALSEIHRKLGEYAASLAYAQKAVDLQPWNASLVLNHAKALWHDGQGSKAMPRLDHLIRSGGAPAEAFALRGVLQNESGEPLLALADLNRALSMDPYSVEAYNLRGLQHTQGEQFADAVRDFNRVLEISPRSWMALNNRGLTLIQMKQYELAIKDFDTAIEYGANISAVYANRGYAHESLGNLVKAREDYQRAIALDPSQPIAYIQLGFLEMKFGHLESARIRLDQAVNTKRDPGVTRYHRALFYYQSQLFAEAYQDLMAASRDGYAPAIVFMPKITPQLSAPSIELP